MMKRSDRDAGFTLIEMVIALAILSVLSILSFQGISSILSNEEKLAASRSRIEDVSRAVTLMTRDLTQMAPYVSQSAALLPGEKAQMLVMENNGLSFSRLGWRNPVQRVQSSLQAVRWTLEAGGLVRRAGISILPGQDAQILLRQVKSLSVRVMKKGGDWQNHWEGDGIPDGVEITLELADLGTVRRVVVVENRSQHDREAVA